MASRDSISAIGSQSEVVGKATLLLVALGLAAFEFFIPRIPLFPWLKPGLANCVTLLWIIRFGTMDALLFVLLRSWTLGFYFGFSFFTLALGLSGGVVATVVMGFLWVLAGRRKILGLIGISICGALAHNAAQLVVVYALMARNAYLFYQAPIMLGASVVFGTFVALLVPLIDSLSRGGRGEGRSDPRPVRNVADPSTTDFLLSFLLFLLCISLIFVRDIRVLLGAAIAVTTATQVIERGSFRAFVRPITRFWMLFLAIGAFHLLLSYGTRIKGIPVVTREGIHETAIQWLRIWTWLQVASVLRAFNFHTVFFALLTRVFHRRPETIYAGLLALECFPSMVVAMRKNATRNLGRIFLHPVQWSQNAVRQTFADVSASVREELLSD